jgi:membrane protein
MLDLDRAKTKFIGAVRLCYRLLDETLDEYTKDRAELAAGGLAFFTLLSIAPLVLIATAIAGTILGSGSAREAALSFVNQVMGEVAAKTVRGWVEQAAASSGLASVIGFLLVLFAASRLMAQLRIALNQVWNVERKIADNIKHSLRDYLARRFFAFLLVLASGPLLLAVFMSRALLNGFHQSVLSHLPFGSALAELSQIAFSLVIVAAISALAFKFVPDAKISAWPVGVGAGVTSVLFNVGNGLVGLYLGRASVAHAYGVAASLIVVLLWLYFSAQVFLFGAEFTQVYARHRGTNGRIESR